MSAIATVEERTRAMRGILRDAPDHPILVDAKTSCLAFMEDGLYFEDACVSLKIEPSVFRELRRQDDAFDRQIRRIEEKITERNNKLRSDTIEGHEPGSDVPLPLDQWDNVSDVIGRDPDLNLGIPGNWKRLFLRHYASTLLRVESLDYSGASAAEYILAVDPDTDNDEYDLDFHKEIQEIELRYTLALEDRQRARAISTGTEGAIKMAMKGLDNDIARKYMPKKAPVFVDKRVQTQINVGKNGNGEQNPVDGLRKLAEIASGPRKLAKAG